LLYSRNFVMRKIIAKTVRFSRVAMTIFMLVALALSGAGAADRLFSAYDRPVEEPESKPDQVALDVAVPGPEEAPENMAPTGTPNGEPNACFVVPLVLKSDNSSSRFKTEGDDSRESLKNAVIELRCKSVMTSSCLIDAHLGRQFTLVGARPSGTS